MHKAQIFSKANIVVRSVYTWCLKKPKSIEIAYCLNLNALALS